MKFNELTVKKQRRTNRVGRGISGGQGKTAGRGTKGQGSRKSPVRHGFEGGQMPLYMRLPKLRGFKSHRAAVETVYTGQLDQLKKANINTTVLAEAGLLSSPYVYAKLILKGDVKGKVTVQLPYASKNAVKALEAAGGSYKETPRLARPSKKTEDK